eukprot:m.303234 g.303234  ORF g.303234 m.303234 type:complete len:342 (-) comp15892_c1_seq6:4063-5088(-)
MNKQTLHRAMSLLQSLVRRPLSALATRARCLTTSVWRQQQLDSDLIPPSSNSDWEQEPTSECCIGSPQYPYDYVIPPTEYTPSVDEEISHFKSLLKGRIKLPDLSINYGYNVFEYDKPFYFELGENTANHGVLSNLRVAYETWGELNKDKSNVILLQTGLSSSSHAASHPNNTNPGWWEAFIGPGKALDTNKFFIICSNNLGSCYGSSGPSDINPATNKPYGLHFPMVTVQDMVRAQFLLLDHLGIEKVHAAVGSSLGGMLSIEAARSYSDRVQRCVSISSAHKAHPTAIALRYEHSQRTSCTHQQAAFNRPIGTCNAELSCQIHTGTVASTTIANTLFSV